MTLAFRNQLSQTAKQIRTLLANPPADWQADKDASAALTLLDLEEEIAVNSEYSEALQTEATRFDDGQRLFLSAFGRLPAASKDAEQKVYDDLLADIRVDDLQSECRQVISTISRRLRAYKRTDSELRAQIAQAQTRAAANITLADNGRDESLLRDLLQQNQQFMQTMQTHQTQQNQQMMQQMQGMLQALTLPQPPAATTPVAPITTTVPAVSVVSTAPAGLTTSATSFGAPHANAGNPLPHASAPVSSAPGGPFPVSIGPISMPIYTTGNMGAQSTFTPHSSHWTTPTGAGFGGQHQVYPQFFSSPFVPQTQQPLHDDRFRLPLPKMEIPYFHGERSKWRGFWQRFELVMSRHPELSNLERLILLLGYLKGDAEKLVEGIPIAEGNYQIVESLLKDAYDNKQMIICGLYNDLQKLEPATNTAKLKELYFQFLKICRQLEGALKTVLNQEEELAELKSDRPKRAKEEMSPIEREKEPDQHYTILSTMVDQMKPPVPQRPCSFCQEKGHWTDECHKYPDYQTRVDRNRELHQCFKCLRTGHSSKKCIATLTNCSHCKRRHNSAICREKFEQKRSDNQEQKPKEKKTGRKANTCQKPQAKIRAQGAIHQVPVVVGHCTVLGQVEIDSIKIQKEGPSKRTLNSIQKQMPTPSHPKTEKESHLAAHVSTPVRPPDWRKRQVKPEAKVQQPQRMPKHCSNERIREKVRITTARRSGLIGQENALTILNRTDHHSRQQNLARDHTDNPIKGLLDLCVQNQTPAIDTPRFYTGKSHQEFPNSVQMPTRSQPTHNSKGVTRNRSALCQTKFEPNEIVVPDSTNAEIKPLRRRRWNILAPGVSRAESRKEPPKISH
ncbi:hypothetical protein Ddc_18494 [Ditylenchus destructor]|nr:hypothetical protein Ddc_18494 [Ditylenchus destructor]